MATKKYLDLDGLSTFKSNIDNTKQDTLVSGTNIKTINGISLLGSGDTVLPYIYTVRVNGHSVSTNYAANIVTNTAYDASTNKIATMADIPTKTIMQAVKTSDTTNYSTNYNYFSPFNGDGDASTDIDIGSGLTFGKKTVTYGDRTNNSVYGITIGAGISLIKVYYSTRYLNNHTANVGVNSNIYRVRDDTPEIVYGTTTTMPSSTRAVLTGEYYMEVTEGDFIFIGGYRTLKATDVDVISTNNATSMYIEVIQ